jgi:hypothetical protein
MGDREKDQEGTNNEPETEAQDQAEAAESEQDEQREDEAESDEAEASDEKSESADAEASDEAGSDADAEGADEAEAEDPDRALLHGEAAKGELTKEASPPAEKPAAASPARPNPLVRFFWMPEQLRAARAQGLDQDKPGWSEYDLAREAVIGAQRLGELSEAKQGVMLLNREAMLLLARAGLARAGAEGNSWSDFAELDTAKPLLEKLSAEERELVDVLLGADGLEQLATLPKDRRKTAGKALAKLASKLYEELEREANRVASVLYMRWLRILGVVLGFVIIVVGALSLIKRSAGGVNLALGAKVSVSSNSRRWGVPPERAVDGNRNDLGFHTNNQKNAWVQLDLGEEKRVRQVVVYNRATNPQRAVPLVVELSSDRRSWDEVAKREEVFDIWTADFSSKKARYVRLRKLNKDFLHLAEVEVY